MNECIEIDGSQGEGGGQILRSALGLALVTGKTVKLVNIRAKRDKPGLLNQHLTCVKAARQISDGYVEGAQLGSQTLLFTPGPVRPGQYRFSIGTAGSTTLVLQTVLPALMMAESESVIQLEGGTHNSMSPSLDFLRYSFLPQLEKMGVTTQVRLDYYGFYPRGGGQWEIRVSPADSLAPLHLTEKKGHAEFLAHAIVVNLRPDIGERELKIVRRFLHCQSKSSELKVIRETNSVGQGNVLNLILKHDNVTEVVTGFGAKRVKAEDVAKQAVQEFQRYLDANVPVGEHLADQLLIPIALAGQGTLRTVAPSQHTLTNIDVIQRLLPVEFNVNQLDQDAWEISLHEKTP